MRKPADQHHFTMETSGMHLVGFWLHVLLLLQLSDAASKDIVCEPITVPMCKGIGYNHTYMPNQFNHDTQDEVGLEVHQFWPLVRIRCSPDLLFFLCSMYTPICLQDYKKPLPPCRSVCERAKRGCSPLMIQYGFEWPERMSCEQLPMLGDTDRLCMDRNSSETTTLSPPFPKPTPKGTPRHRATAKSAPPQKCERECHCRNPLVIIKQDAHPLHNRVHTGSLPNCALPCHQPYFSLDEHAFTTFWIGLWSVLCFVSTLTTVATFLIDMERFQYPERPIIFLAACYLFVSLGYIVRLLAGHERVACEGSGNQQHILYDTTGPALCTLVFLLIYFLEWPAPSGGWCFPSPGSWRQEWNGGTRPSQVTRSTSTLLLGSSLVSSPSLSWLWVRWMVTPWLGSVTSATRVWRAYVASYWHRWSSTSSLAPSSFWPDSFHSSGSVALLNRAAPRRTSWRS